MRKLGFFLWAGQLFLIFIFWRLLPLELPLFYSRPWGKEQLTTPTGLFIIPAFSLLVFIINLILVSLLPKEEKLIDKVLLATIVVFNFLGLVNLVQIIRLVV